MILSRNNLHKELQIKKTHLFFLAILLFGVITGSYYFNKIDSCKVEKVKCCLKDFSSAYAIQDIKKSEIFKLDLKDISFFILIWLSDIFPFLVFAVLYKIFIKIFKISFCITFFLDTYGFNKFIIFFAIFFKKILFLFIVLFYLFLVINNSKFSFKGKTFKVLNFENIIKKLFLLLIFTFITLFLNYIFSYVTPAILNFVKINFLFLSFRGGFF
jgi:hypothetical protein